MTTISPDLGERESLRPVIADILRGLPRQPVLTVDTRLERRWRGAAILDHVEATDLRDRLAEATEIIEMRDAEVDSVTAEMEQARDDADRLHAALIEYAERIDALDACSDDREEIIAIVAAMRKIRRVG